MSSNILEAIKDLRKNLHNVGSLNNWNKTSLNQGVVADEVMDNFTLVKIEFDQNGERIAKPITDNGEKGVLVASVEDYMQGYETISSFFNDKGERIRVVATEIGMRFECSNFELENENTAVNPIKNGMVAHYKQDTKKFHISNVTLGGVPEYAGAANKVVVVDANPVSIDGQQIIRFEVTQ